MYTFPYKNNIFLAMFLLSLTVQPVFAKNMYRWIDENGNVIYSDQIPPNQSKHRREYLNKDAQTVTIVEKEKTKDQYELEQRLILLREKQKEIIAKHKAYDNVLLTTFRNIEDMKMSLKEKVSSLDGQKNIIKGNLNRIETQLRQQQQKAAQYERDGKKLPTKLLTSIADSKKQIKVILQEISRQNNNKKKIVAKFEEDIARFAFLTQSKMASKAVSHKTAEDKAANELGLFLCSSEMLCNKAWQRARQFVINNSMTPINFATNRLIMSQAPLKDTELSLSVSKMNTENFKQLFFLDIRCRNSFIGEQLCNGIKAKYLRKTFNQYIKSSGAE